MEQYTASEKNKQTSLITRHKYEEGYGADILNIIGLEDDTKWFATLGNYKITETFDTKEELIKFLDKKTTLFILTLTSAAKQATDAIEKLIKSEELPDVTT